MKPSSFHIYNASAGSGKTFTLVKNYLKVLFSSRFKEPYRHVLAITFTNKAVAEMKDRIIKNLKDFSSPQILINSTDMFDLLCEELHIKPRELHTRAQDMLESIMHNYGSFDVSTIDKFNQRLIRAFAYHLHLPLNFEVELDTEQILSEAVDNLIALTGSDEKLTKLLVEFAIEKADDDKSFNIEYDFNQIAKLISNEANLEYIDLLKDKSLDDFSVFKSDLVNRLRVVEKEIVSTSSEVLTLIEQSGLEFSDFTSGYLPKHFEKLSGKSFDVSFTNKWQETIETAALYPKRVALEISSIIDAIQPEIASAFNETKQLVSHWHFLMAIYKNLTPLSVLNAINKEVELIKKERNIVLISEFNAIVSHHIKSQPAPFIYERIGEKFKHYFIDEFQDTSIMQWENLIPLINNALSSEETSALLVGDAKQAIYRWRGGKAEQFIELFGKGNPFQTVKHVLDLQSNHRSARSIIDFNNAFFKHLSSFAFSEDVYAGLFTNVSQDVEKDAEGYVNLSFLEFSPEDDKDALYSEHVLDTIRNCINNGFDLKDICILVRRNKEGVAIADYLIEHSDLDIISSETLLLTRSSEVTFIVDLIKSILDNKDKATRINMLSYIAENKLAIDDRHEFYASLIELNLEQMFIELEKYGIFFKVNDVLQLSLYEAIEVIIHDFELVKTSDAYVQFFLDFVLEYTAKQSKGLSGFIEYFEQKKDKLSIVASGEKNAVQIMTIHKSKGLEFPVVIFPYADVDIYFDKNAKIWFPLDQREFKDFSYALINYNKQLENFGTTGEQLYNEHTAELELDNLNILYVALTRPVEQLHIISEKKLGKNGEENLKYFSGLFINYLKHTNVWNEKKNSFSFGDPKRTMSFSTAKPNSEIQNQFISTPLENLNVNIVAKSGYLWNTMQQEAIEKGNLIHLILAQIKSEHDIDFALNSFLNTGIISFAQYKELKPIIVSIVTHSDLKTYFSIKKNILNEKEIITEQGISMIPDRIVFENDKKVVIIDYKTGVYKNAHVDQIKGYENVIKKMGLTVLKSILIYINDSIEIKEV